MSPGSLRREGSGRIVISLLLLLLWGVWWVGEGEGVGEVKGGWREGGIGVGLAQKGGGANGGFLHQILSPVPDLEAKSRSPIEQWGFHEVFCFCL